MPQATDLVTDLPADFEVFGQAVATSMADLLGGTTGQILAKASATDMDFAWIANDQGDITGVTAGTGITVTSPTGPVPTVAIDTAVTVDKTTAQTLTNKTLTSPALTTPTISTATTNGDILYGTGSGALARLGIGTTGQTLSVSGGIPAWATPTSGSMTLINSGGTTLTGSLVTISSIPATYKDLKIEVKNYRPATDNEFLRMRVNLDTTANVYGGRTLGFYDANELWASYGYTSWDISVAMTNTTNNEGYFVVYLNDYANTVTFKVAQNTSIANATTNPTTAYASNSQNLFYKPTAAINSVSFLTSSGNMTSGTAYVYEVN